MDFQAPNPAPEKASALLPNEIFLSTNEGVVCLKLEDVVSTNLNFSSDDFETVTDEIFMKDPPTNHISIASYSDTTTLDSDDPTSSDCSAIRTYLTNEYDFDDNKPKRRGGWPKGRKRKPDLLHLPPKAPATGYNLYLNATRKDFKNSGLAAHEITKVIGNQWSSLTLDQKQPFLKKAEEDKRRYKDELRAYQQSGSYQMYLAKKRKKRAQNNILSESDMDATDDIDEEDNEELYCRTCDQYFHNLHNKREHLQSRTHTHAVVGDMRRELNPTNPPKPTAKREEETKPKSVSEIIVDLISAVFKREKEMNTINMNVQESKAEKKALSQQLASLKERLAKLQNELFWLQNLDRDLQNKIFDLWQVPSIFITTDLTYSDIELSEYSVTE